MSLHQDTTQEGKDVVLVLRDSWVKEVSSAKYVHSIAISRYHWK